MYSVYAPLGYDVS